MYKSKLTVLETQDIIRSLRHRFEENLCDALNLRRVSAPLFVSRGSGINDDLNGVERPVSFDILQTGEVVEVVHSLAKWKRAALGKYGFSMHTGLYTDMNAIRRDEVCDSVHSLYVDQWDWEKIISKDERTEENLKDTVRDIFKVIKHMEHEVWYKFPQAVYHLPDEIHFVTTQELEDRWPDLTPLEREDKIAKELGAVFVMKIGDMLQRSGKPHDGRAPDYDDWSLNGDIIFWYEPLQRRIEISSMGIRVSPESMKYQLEQADATDREKLPFHKMLLNGELPYTIGGGIGQSRLCMLLLGKAHIGEVQASIWPEDMIKKCEENHIQIL